MGQWEQWSQWACDKNAGDCGECTQDRVKRVKTNCDNGGDCSCKEETAKNGKLIKCPVDCVMGQWEKWSQWSCENKADECGKCIKMRVKKEKIQCKYGGDCSCKEELERDGKDEPCRKSFSVLSHFHNNNFRKYYQMYIPIKYGFLINFFSI